MATCCDDAVDQVPPSSNQALTVALAGNPNCGKTTIFNALTGLRQKVANYPGVTVERKTGRCKLPDGTWANIIDLPGTYSLISRSPDEVVAMEVLRGLRADTPAPNVVVVVVDASNLQRNLYLVSQLIELGRPLVVALNMMDVATRRGVHVSPERLEEQLGVPVVPVVGHKKQGIDRLKEAILQARVAPMPDWPLPQVMKEELAVVGGGLAILDSEDSIGIPAHGYGARTPISEPKPGGQNKSPADDPRRLDRYLAIAERLLIGDRADDVGQYTRYEPVASLLQSAAQRLERMGVDPMQADIEAHYRWIEAVADSATARVEDLAAMGNAPTAVDDTPVPAAAARDHAGHHTTLSDRIDALAVHKFWGLLIFAAVMGSLFFAIFWLADPVMGTFEELVAWLGQKVTSGMSDGPLKALLSDGIFAGVGAVVVFVPQIAMLFLFLALLEDSGYLARAAFLMDRILARVGLHGKSFIPLLSSFACAIPGVLATRTIENRKDRLATILVAPFMSCSARLPVYALLIGAFFGGYSALTQAGIMFGLYTLGIIAAALTAWAFKRTLLKGPTSAFILEMPSYKMPQPGQVLRVVANNTWEFLKRAGTIIFCMSVILWAMSYYPRLPEDRSAQIAAQVESTVTAAVESEAESAEASAEEIQQRIEQEVEEALAGEQLRYSIAGRIGQVLEPAIQPLGYDWKMGVGLVGAFAAREVFVSTMGIIYSVGDPGEDTTVLSDAMHADTYPDGRTVWSPLVAVSLLVWFVLAMQCMSTLAVVRRETGGWGWPLFMLLYMNALAYVVCLGIYQVGSRVMGL